MYILPTFFGTVDLPAIRSDFPVLENTPENESLRLWNRLFCPQCILNTVLANTVVVRRNLNFIFLLNFPSFLPNNRIVMDYHCTAGYVEKFCHSNSNLIFSIIDDMKL